MKSGESEMTTDHDIIRKWAKDRKGQPASINLANAQNDPELLRIVFYDDARPGPDPELITWDKFFEIFEANELAFLYQDITSSGKTSRFFKFVRR